MGRFDYRTGSSVAQSVARPTWLCRMAQRLRGSTRTDYSGTRRMTMNQQPLSLAFNAEVMTMANKVCPCGYDVDPDYQPTFEGLNEYIERTGRIMVNSKYSENTIFADAEHNYAFRAWHDWTHWIIQAP